MRPDHLGAPPDAASSGAVAVPERQSPPVAAASLLYTPKLNQILAALPGPDYARLLPDLGLAELPRDRPGLERRVCESYAVVKKQFSRLLPYRLTA